MAKIVNISPDQSVKYQFHNMKKGDLFMNGRNHVCMKVSEARYWNFYTNEYERADDNYNYTPFYGEIVLANN